MASRGEVVDDGAAAPVRGDLRRIARERFVAEGIFPPGGFACVTHIHPHQDESFEVLAGAAAFEVEGEHRVLEAGETIEVPRGARHTFANAGPDEMRVRFEFRPGLSSTERFYELYFAFAQEGRVNARAMPGLLDIAMVWPQTSEHAVLASPPAFVQHALFGALAPIARWARRRPPVIAVDRPLASRPGPSFGRGDVTVGPMPHTNRSAPTGPVIPVLSCPDVAAAVRWLVDVLGFTERLRIGDHRAQLEFGDGSLIVADTGSDRVAPEGDAVVQLVMLRVSDLDRLHDRAIAAGAVETSAPQDFPYGERQSSFRDPVGHRWTLTQTIRDVAPEDWGGTSAGDG
jgi:uncharacterized glyoxalase superfamily protein PhnB